MVELVDKQIQNKLQLKLFITSNVYKEYKEDIKQHLECISGEIETLTRQAVGPEELCSLNFKNGRKAGLQCALYMLESLEEEFLA